MSWKEMPSPDNNNGVRIETVDTDHDGQRVDNYLASRLKGLPRSRLYRLIRTGQVRINGKRCKPASRLSEGDQVRIPPARVASREEVPISERVIEQLRSCILHQDGSMLIVDKPSGMAVHAGSGLPWGIIDVLRRMFPGEFIELVHRLDRETSGCLLLARNGAALKRLSEQFRAGEIGKRYLCLMDGRLPEAVVEVDAPLARIESGQRRRVEVTPDGKQALTRFSRLQSWPGATYAEAELLTGRTHQIRVHARHLGLPLAGDPLYSDRESLKRWRARGLKRIFLHAHLLQLEGDDGRMLEFSAPLPAELRSVLDSLE
jgi:23S rRNA pseudouridine955/2504/2580 synthase